MSPYAVITAIVALAIVIITISMLYLTYVGHAAGDAPSSPTVSNAPDRAVE